MSSYRRSQSTLGAVYVPYGLLHLGFSAFGLGLTLALAGVGGLAGAGLSERAGRAGLTIPLAWALQAAGIAIIALTPVGSLLVAARAASTPRREERKRGNTGDQQAFHLVE